MVNIAQQNDKTWIQRQSDGWRFEWWDTASLGRSMGSVMRGFAPTSEIGSSINDHYDELDKVCDLGEFDDYNDLIL